MSHFSREANFVRLFSKIFFYFSTFLSEFLKIDWLAILQKWDFLGKWYKKWCITSIFCISYKIVWTSDTKIGPKLLFFGSPYKIMWTSDTNTDLNLQGFVSLNKIVTIYKLNPTFSKYFHHGTKKYKIVSVVIMLKFRVIFKQCSSFFKKPKKP